MQTAHVQLGSSEFPSTPELAFLTSGDAPGHAYYVLTHLQRYGNTIINSEFIQHYGLEPTKHALEALLRCPVKLRLAVGDDPFYVVELADVKQRQNLRIPPALDKETLQRDLDFLTYIVIANDSRAEKTLYALLNGEDTTYTYSISVYHIAFGKNGIAMQDLSNGQIVVFTLPEIEKILQREEIFDDNE